MSDPQECFFLIFIFKTTVEGWNNQSGNQRPKAEVSIHDLIDCLEIDIDISNGQAGYQRAMVNVLIRKLQDFCTQAAVFGWHNNKTIRSNKGGTIKYFNDAI